MVQTKLISQLMITTFVVALFTSILTFASNYAYSTSQFPTQEDFWKNKITPMLFNEMENNFSDSIQRNIQRNIQKDDLSVIVYLKQQADLTNLIKGVTFKNREEQTSFVRKILVNVAKTSQPALVKWLSENKINFQRFYISNMIALFDITPEIVYQLAQREDVAKITLNSKFKALPDRGLVDLNFDQRFDQRFDQQFDQQFEQLFDLELDDLESSLDPNYISIFKHKGVGANISSTGADRVWNELKIRGQGIVVAGQDTGIDWQHPALVRQYRGNITGNVANADHSYSWHDSIKQAIGSGSNSCGYNLKSPCDDNGHGSHTMGSIVGDDGNGNQIGMAPNAKWIGCRNMDAGVGRPSTYIECFEWFLAPYPQGKDPMAFGDPTKAPHVINNSWGCDSSEGCKDAEILPVLKSLMAAGIMVVASAGNDGSACSTIKTPPAMHSEETLSVGAHNHSSGTIASFSSRGPSVYDNGVGPDVTAPGVNIRSSTPGGNYSGFMWSGTSMAGPHVVGEVALIWSANNKLIGKISETVNIVRKTATAKTTSETCGGVAGNKIPNNTYGYGAINAYSAVKSALK
ncbi:MAG: S8 family serine peptidase [Oligoflexia bacterium]|nr:S8 family serine peptidase [Oligoflexia bacterium]